MTKRSPLRLTCALCVTFAGTFALLHAFGLLLPGARAHDGERRGPPVQVPKELRAKTTLCTDNKSHYVAITPDEPETDENQGKRRFSELYYGDGKRFFLVPQYKGLTRTLFRDPRFYNKNAPGPGSPMGRDTDFRLVSGVKFEDGQCSAWCGERQIPLQVVEPAKAQALLGNARFEQSPRRFAHHALARDDEGTYYYVDHGYFAETAKSYRLFIGQKRALKEQPITDVTSDSAGDVIITRAGTLSLGRDTAKWIAAGKTTPLHALPLDESREEAAKNVLLIYNELGVYKGERLGTPCDEL